jgi:hypothetical protein
MRLGRWTYANDSKFRGTTIGVAYEYEQPNDYEYYYYSFGGSRR